MSHDAKRPREVVDLTGDDTCCDSREPFSGDGNGPLSAADLAAFERDGFLILRSVVSAAECERFVWQSVVPALLRAGISPFDEATWYDRTGDTDGARIRAPSGSDHPIHPSEPDSRWLPLRGSRRLLGALAQLHGGAMRWRWSAGAASGVGWIHLRFPVHPAAAEWPPIPPGGGWHIDGHDAAQSVVVLPLVTPIARGGGGTALIAGSHRTVAGWLHGSAARGAGRHGGGVDRVQLYIDHLIVPSAIAAHGEGRGVADAADLLPGGAWAGATAAGGAPRPVVVEATGAAGDVLLMHPLLVHSTSMARRLTFSRSPAGVWSATRHGIRVTFNLSTAWNARHRLAQPSCGRAAEARPAATAHHSAEVDAAGAAHKGLVATPYAAGGGAVGGADFEGRHSGDCGDGVEDIAPREGGWGGGGAVRDGGGSQHRAAGTAAHAHAHGAVPMPRGGAAASPLEACALRSRREAAAAGEEHAVRYGEPVRILFRAVGRVLSVDNVGVARASAAPASVHASQLVWFEPHGARRRLLPKGRAVPVRPGDAVCDGDAVVVACLRHAASHAHLHVAPALPHVPHGDRRDAVAMAKWDDRCGGWQRFILEAPHGAVPGAPLRAGDAFYLKTGAQVQSFAPGGSHLVADPDDAGTIGGDRLVRAASLERGWRQALEVLKW